MKRKYTHALMKADFTVSFTEIASKLKEYGDLGYRVVSCVIDNRGQILWTLEREE